MFTGIVSAVGRVAKATREAGNGTRETGLTLTFRAPYKGLKKGESVAVNGACLTVERVVKGGFQVHVIETTEGRTLFAEYGAGRRESHHQRPAREGSRAGLVDTVHARAYHAQNARRRGPRSRRGRRAGEVREATMQHRK